MKSQSQTQLPTGLFVRKGRNESRGTCHMTAWGWKDALNSVTFPVLSSSDMYNDFGKSHSNEHIFIISVDHSNYSLV